MSGYQKEELPLDHFCMNKFEDEYDSNYLSVAREIDRMAQKAVKMRAKGEAEPKMLLPFQGNPNGFEFGSGLCPGGFYQLSSRFH